MSEILNWKCIQFQAETNPNSTIQAAVRVVQHLPFGWDVLLRCSKGTKAMFFEKIAAALLYKFIDSLTPPAGMPVTGELQNQSSVRSTQLNVMFINRWPCEHQLVVYTHLDRLSIRTPCFVSVSLVSILMPNALSTSRTNEMAPVSGFISTRKESFTTSHLSRHQGHQAGHHYILIYFVQKRWWRSII